MSTNRRFIAAGTFLLFILVTVFFLSVRFGAKLYYFQESSFSAFKTMRNLEALRTDKVDSDAIKELIKEEETDLDAELMTVSSYQKSGLIYLDFIIRHSDDTVLLRSIADYRERYPSTPMDTTVLNKEQRQWFLRFYSDAIKEQKLLLEKYR